MFVFLIYFVVFLQCEEVCCAANALLQTLTVLEPAITSTILTSILYSTSISSSAPAVPVSKEEALDMWRSLRNAPFMRTSSPGGALTTAEVDKLLRYCHSIVAILECIARLLHGGRQQPLAGNNTNNSVKVNANNKSAECSSGGEECHAVDSLWLSKLHLWSVV